MPKTISTKNYDMRSFAKVPFKRLPKNINTEEDLKANLQDIYIIEDYMHDQLGFVAFYNHLFNVFVNCYPIGNLRNHVVKFKLYHSDKMVLGFQFKKFICAVPIFGALQLLWNEIHVDDIFIMKSFDNSVLKEIMNEVNYLMTSYDIPIDIRSAIVTDTYYRYTQLSYTLADILNVSLSYEDYIRPAMTIDAMRKITDEPIPVDLQPTEIKNEIAKRSAALKEIYMSIDNNCIGIILKSKTKINERQFQEMNISHGQIPDVYGNFIMRTMKNSGFNRGLESPGDYYLAATVSRYAAIINKEDMGDIGYFFRNVSIICGSVKLSETIHDCKTNHFLPYTVTDLKLVENKYYKEKLGDKELKVIRREDKHLIGKTLYLRSIAYCACGDEVCHVCYGEDYKFIEDLPGMGIYNSQIITNPVYQGVLSVKHAIDGNIKTIDMNQEFNDIFKLVENFIETSDDIESDNYILLIENSLLDEMDYKSENFGLVSDPVILVGENKTIKKCELYNIQDITYNTAIIRALKPSKRFPGYYQCPLSILEEEGTITLTLSNYGVSDVLKDFKKLVQYDAPKYTVNEFLDNIMATVKRAKIKAKLIQIEVLMNRLIRDPNDLTRRPNYSNDVVEDCILTLPKALMNMKGVVVRLSFEQLKRQILSYDQYNQFGDAYTQALFELYQYTNNFDEE